MLVPNPNDDGIEPFIGDDKISDLSDLSDHINDNEDEDNSDFVSSESEHEGLQGEEKVVLPKLVEEIVLKPKNTETAIPSTDPTDAVSLADVPRRPSNSSFSSRDSSTFSETESNANRRFSSMSTITASTAQRKVKKAEIRPIDSIKLVLQPSDIHVKPGRTARFACVVSEDSPEFSKSSQMWFIILIRRINFPLPV